MSLDPKLGHLYNDHTSSVDAKEQLRIREVNARGQRNLTRDKYVIERARSICERSRRWEHENVKRQMKKIRERTLSLELSLKQEAKRAALFDKVGNSRTPTLVSRTSVFVDVPREVKSAPDIMSSARSVTGSNSYKRRSGQVVRSLFRMYNRSDERKRLCEEQPFKLDPFQIDALQKAKLVLKGTEAEYEVSKILAHNSTLRTEPKQARVYLPDPAMFSFDTDNTGGLQGINGQNRVVASKAAPTTWTRFPKVPVLWQHEDAKNLLRLKLNL